LNVVECAVFAVQGKALQHHHAPQKLCNPPRSELTNRLKE